MKYALGIDLGASKLRMGLVRKDGRIDRIRSSAVPGGIEPGVCADLVCGTIFDLTGGKAGLKKKVSRIALASAGQIDKKTGVIIHSPNHDWRNVPFARMVSSRLGMPVAIENDVNAAALGEFHFGAGAGCRHLIAMFVGSGIGGGFILDGRLYTGTSGAAAEIGHMVYRENGPKCGCGKRGCFEVYGGGLQLERRYNRARARAGRSGRLKATEICRAARGGDALAMRYWDQATRALSALAVNLVVTLNPDVLVIGGSIGEKAPGLVTEIARTVRVRATSSAAASVRVLRPRTGADAGILGASVLGARR